MNIKTRKMSHAIKTNQIYFIVLLLRVSNINVTIQLSGFMKRNTGKEI